MLLRMVLMSVMRCYISEKEGYAWLRGLKGVVQEIDDSAWYAHPE
jgi:hypothetical protein